MKRWLIHFMIFVTPFIIVLMKSGIMSKSKESPCKGGNTKYPRSGYKLSIDIFVSFFIVYICGPFNKKRPRFYPEFVYLKNELFVMFSIFKKY